MSRRHKDKKDEFNNLILPIKEKVSIVRKTSEHIEDKFPEKIEGGFINRI